MGIIDALIDRAKAAGFTFPLVGGDMLLRGPADQAAIAAELKRNLEPIRRKLHPRPDDELPAFAKMLTTAELCGMDLRPNFLIDGVLVEGQPQVVGGPSKTLKTTIVLDELISLATGTPFLGQFTTQQRKVGFWTGESGAATIRETARRIAAAKGMRLEDVPMLWSFNLPRLSDIDHLFHFEQVIRENEIKVACVDPLYLALLSPATAGSAGNIYAMGAALQPLSEIGVRTGCTLVVLHHFKKSIGDDAEPASLEMLSQAGIVEWARQWVLLQRQSPYQADGKHPLWMRCGGSAGHAGLWGLDIDEGVLDTQTMGGRRWDVKIQTVHDARKAVVDNAERLKQDQKAARDADDKRKVRELLCRLSTPETKSVIRDASGLTTERTGKALTALIGEGYCRLVELIKNRRTETGFQYSDPSVGNGRERSGYGRESAIAPAVGGQGREASYREAPDRPTDGDKSWADWSEQSFPTDKEQNQAADFSKALSAFNSGEVSE